MSPDPGNPVTVTPAWPTRDLFGVPICAAGMDAVLGIVDETIRRRGRLLIGAVNAAKIVNMQRDALLRQAVLEAHLILPDGMGVVWAARWLKQRLPGRVTGIDLMHAMLEQGNRRRYRVFCLGATEAVLEEAVARIVKDHPGIVLAGKRNGYFNADEESSVVEEIRASRADLLLVAMSSPKKEVFLAQWWRSLDVPVCHGVGGAFDVLAGRVHRAPALWQRLGLEWFYRMAQEPGRLWRRYLVTNTLFCRLVFREWVRGVARSGSEARRAS